MEEEGLEELEIFDHRQGKVLFMRFVNGNLFQMVMIKVDNGLVSLGRVLFPLFFYRTIFFNQLQLILTD